MILWAMLAALAVAGVLFLPVWIRVRLVYRAGEIQFTILPWGLSLGSGRLMKWLSRRLEGLLDRFLSRKPQKAAEPPSETDPSPRKKTKQGLPWRLVLWLAGRAMALVGHLTRRLSLRVAGWDPALMGFCQGAVGGLLAALGIRQVRWESDFGPSAPFAELTWDFGGSLLGLGVWLVRNLRKMPSRGKAESPPPGTVFSSLA